MTLNILFLTPNLEDRVCLNFFDYLEKDIGKLVNCAWAGFGHSNHVPNRSIDKTVKRVMPDADWVIFWEFEFRWNGIIPKILPPEQRKYKTASYVGDLHVWQGTGKNKTNMQTIPRRVNWLNSVGFDALLMIYTKIGITDTPLIFRPLVFHMAPCVSQTLFSPLKQKREYDVAFLGSHHARELYPLRDLMWTGLPSIARRNHWKILMRRNPGGAALKRSIKEKLLKGEIVGKEYARVLALTKTFPFGTSVFRYPILKFFEAMACRTCVLADTPLTAEELHLIPDWNFVEINKDNWERKLEYYVSHDEEREEIAQRGYDTFIKYHTTEVRARQVVDFLEGHK